MKSKFPGVLAAGALACFIALPAMAASKNDSNSHTTNKAEARPSWPAEDLSGTVAQVKPGMKLLIVKDSDGVPFDIDVTPATRIEQNGKRIPLNQLEAAHESVSVHFKPERRGDVAESIQVSG